MMQTGFKFIHSADLHLGQTFKNTEASDQFKEIIKEAPFAALKKLVDTAIQENVDAFILAGDVFNGNPTKKVAAKFVEIISPLQNYGIYVYVACGNHDPYAY